MTDLPWSTQPITGAQHDAWMAEERARWECLTKYPAVDPEHALARGLVGYWLYDKHGVLINDPRVHGDHL